LRPSRHAWALPLLSVLAIVISGCGGGSTSSTPPPAPTFYRVLAAGRDVGSPPIKENLTQAERRITSTVASGDCDQIKELFVHTVVHEQPDQSCETLSMVVGARLSGAKAYNDQAAVLDYSTAHEASSIVLLRDVDGLLRIAFVAPHIRPTTVDTPLVKSADRIAGAVVAAVRAGDCEAFIANANSAGGVGALPDRQACQQMATDPIRQAQFDGSAIKPTRLGGNGWFAFYSLDGASVHATMVLAKADPGAGQQSPRAAPDRYGYVASYVTNTPAGAVAQ
jgi:hypothetical protein